MGPPVLSGFLAQLSTLAGARKSLQAEAELRKKGLYVEKALPKLLAASDKRGVEAKFKALLATGAGTYALIDYVNFKGEGTNPKERYKGEGWGLLQVLEGMEGDSAKDFGASAARVLTRRVENSDPARNEHKWLAGWLSRVRAY